VSGAGQVDEGQVEQRLVMRAWIAVTFALRRKKSLKDWW
jgi:hypothetical protein